MENCIKEKLHKDFTTESYKEMKIVNVDDKKYDKTCKNRVFGS